VKNGTHSVVRSAGRRRTGSVHNTTTRRIRYLHEKVDHLLSHQWERLVEIQLDLLSEIGRKG
jgi:hypothetical protein